MYPIIAHRRRFPDVRPAMCGRSDRVLLLPRPQFPHVSQTNPLTYPAGAAAGQTRLILCIAIPTHGPQGPRGPLPCPRGDEVTRQRSQPSAGSDPSSAACRPHGLGQVSPWTRASASPSTAGTRSPEDCGCDYLLTALLAEECPQRRPCTSPHSVPGHRQGRFSTWQATPVSSPCPCRLLPKPPSWRLAPLPSFPPSEGGFLGLCPLPSHLQLQAEGRQSNLPAKWQKGGWL